MADDQTTRSENFAVDARMEAPNSDSKALAHQLFDEKKPKYLSEVIGPLNAKFVPLTPLAMNLYKKMFEILDRSKIEYFLFAGSMVGYLRDREMPYWLDDIDIIIFEDQFEKFEKNAIPDLKNAGFIVMKPNKNPNGGYHVLALRETEQHDSHIWFSKSHRVRVPRAQLDVFFSRVDEKGIVRNTGHWGLYHKKNIPAEWVMPGTFVSIMDREFRVFSNFERDILYEYGDIYNNIAVYSHGNKFLYADNASWAEFSTEFNSILSHLAKQSPPKSSIENHEIISTDFRALNPPKDFGFSEISSIITLTKPKDLVLSHPCQWLWAADLRKEFANLNICLRVEDMRLASRAAHVSFACNSIEAANIEIFELLQKNLATLKFDHKPQLLLG